MLGRFIAERGLRNSLVVATKAGFAAGKGPHAGGNGAKHVYASLEASLRRLQTDYIDLYWMHVWDGVTPAEELLETMAALVRAGKIRYWGMSNAPAWFVAKLATMAQMRGLPGPIAVQYFYSLANRDIEHEIVPMAAEFGLGIVPWSPLAFGLLTGKYDRASVEAGAPRAAGLPSDGAAPDQPQSAGGHRLDGNNPFGDSLFTDRNWALVDVLKTLAGETGLRPASIAYAWLNGRRGVTSILLGVSRVEQLDENIATLDIALTAQQRAALDAASATAPSMLHSLFTPGLRRQAVFGGSAVRAWWE